MNADKDIAQKVKVDADGWFCCPRCYGTFGLVNHLGNRNKFCGDCGQRIDWSEYPRTDVPNNKTDV